MKNIVFSPSLLMMCLMYCFAIYPSHAVQTFSHSHEMQPASTQPREASIEIELLWDGPGGVVVVLNDAEYVARGGHVATISVPLNKALKLCLKKPFETVCAEYYLIVTGDAKRVRVTEEAGRAFFELSNKEGEVVGGM